MLNSFFKELKSLSVSLKKRDAFVAADVFVQTEASSRGLRQKKKMSRVDLAVDNGDGHADLLAKTILNVRERAYAIM